MILSLLAEGSSNGYGLIKAIEEKTGGAWRPSPGSVYPTLQQLVDEELISPTGDGRRTEYELTEASKAYWLSMRTISGRPGRQPQVSPMRMRPSTRASGSCSVSSTNSASLPPTPSARPRSRNSTRPGAPSI